MIRDKKFTLEYIAIKTSKRECLVCGVNLDKEFGEKRWHVPLCVEHRIKLLEEMK